MITWNIYTTSPLLGSRNCMYSTHKYADHYQAAYRRGLLLKTEKCGLFVWLLCSWALLKHLNRSRCGLGADLSGSKKPCIRWGQDPPWERAIFGVVRLTKKNCESPLQSTQQKGSSTINNGMMRGLGSKFVEILWPLVSRICLHHD